MSDNGIPNGGVKIPDIDAQATAVLKALGLGDEGESPGLTSIKGAEKQNWYSLVFIQ